MNERIRTLWLQAGGTFTSGNQHEWPSARIDNPEKFAELIVRECIEVIDNTSDNTKLMRPDPYQKIIWAIEEHFGVEE